MLLLVDTASPDDEVEAQAKPGTRTEKNWNLIWLLRPFLVHEKLKDFV